MSAREDRPLDSNAAPASLGPAERTAARWYGLLLLIYIGFIVAATLSVDTGVISLEKGLTKLTQFRAALFDRGTSIHDLRDIATNVLLFAPLGVIAAARAATLGRHSWRTPWLALGLAVSLMVELAQAFTDRSPDPIDLVTNGTGYVAGFIAVIVAVRRFGFQPAALLGLAGKLDDQAVRTTASLLFLYLCGYLVLQLVPFDFSVSLGRIHAKLLAGEGEARIIADPLYHLRQRGDGLVDVFYAMLGVVPAGALKGHLDALRGRHSLITAMWFATALATLIELTQLFVVSRTTDIAYIVFAPIGGAAGWGLAWAWERLRGMEVSEHARTRRERVYLMTMAAISYIFFLAVLAWAPYRFETNIRTVFEKLYYQTNWVPYRLHFEQHSLAAIRDLIEETAQFVPLGFLLSIILVVIGVKQRLLGMLLTAGMCAAIAVGLEFGQAFCVGRVVDTTDVVSAGLGGVIGALLLSPLALVRGGPAQRPQSAP